eukprot:jgi/Tetstr1/447296/TSEL_034733.t1
MGFSANFKEAFAFGLGYGAARFVMVIFGLAFLVGGYILLNREQKKEKEDQKTSTKVGAYALMVVGIALMGGAGIYLLFSELSEDL